MNLVRVIEIF